MRNDPNKMHSFVITLSKNEALLLANEISRSMQFYDLAAKKAFVDCLHSPSAHGVLFSCVSCTRQGLNTRRFSDYCPAQLCLFYVA